MKNPQPIYESTFVLLNGSDRQITVRSEPIGLSDTLPPGKAFVFKGESRDPGCFDVEYTTDGVTVSSWGRAYVEVYYLEKPEINENLSSNCGPEFPPEPEGWAPNRLLRIRWGEPLSKEKRLLLQDTANELALKVQAGKIVDHDLEDSKYGWVYRYTILGDDNHRYRVILDSMTGKIHEHTQEPASNKPTKET